MASKVRVFLFVSYEQALEFYNQISADPYEIAYEPKATGDGKYTVYSRRLSVD